MFHTRWTRAAVLVCALAPAHALAQQPPITLDRYQAAATPEDDFHVERASDFGHLRAGAQLSIEAQGFGPERPLVESAHTAAGRARNRHVAQR